MRTLRFVRGFTTEALMDLTGCCPLKTYRLDDACSVEALAGKENVEWNVSVEWNVPNLVNVEYMFKGAVRMNRPLDQWNCSKDIGGRSTMFSGANNVSQRVWWCEDIVNGY